MRKSVLAAIALLLLTCNMICNIGCKRKLPFEKNTLTLGLSATANTLDPRFATDATGQRITSLLFSALVYTRPDLQIAGDAAIRWELKGRTYHFTLQPHLKFSDGKPLTSEDLQFSFQEYAQAANPFHTALDGVIKVTARYDEKEQWIDIELKKPKATFLSDLRMIKLLPKHAVLNKDLEFAKALTGSGSFLFVSQSANEIILQANKTHPYDPPQIERLVFKVIRDDSTRYLKMLKGDLDIVQSDLPPSKIAIFESKPDFFQVFKYPGLSMTYLLLNLQDPLLRNLRSRKALALALDRANIIRYKLEGLATPATSLLSPANPFFDSDLKAIPYDLSQAKKEILALGLNTHPLTLKTSNSPTAIENGKVIANQLQLAGIPIQQQSYEWGTFYGDVQKGNFQIATMKWTGLTDPDIYRMAFHSREFPPGHNRGRYESKTLDELLDQGPWIMDLQKRKVLYRKIQEFVLQDLPIIPLWYDLEVAVASRSVKNYVPSPLGDYRPLLKVSKEELKR